MTAAGLLIEHRLDLLLSDPFVPSLVRRYFDPATPFAGHTFDTLGDNPCNEIVPADLLAVSLLDVAFGAAAVRDLLESPSKWTALLDAIPRQDVPLWDLDAAGHTAGSELWVALRKLPGVGPTKTSKLLARKRPALVPITDRIIDEYLPRGTDDFWWLLHRALQDPVRREAIDHLGDGLHWRPTTLRLIDVAIWMRFSGSRNAQNARKDVDAPSDPISKYGSRLTY